MAQPMKELYEFGSFTLDVHESRLLREGRAIPLKPKVLETLVVLVENTGRTLDKEELMKRLWPDSYVEEANLAVNISQLRKALGENGDTYIETVPKRGYRFNAQVTKVLADPVDMIVRERTRARVVIDEEETDGQRALPAADVTAAFPQTLSKPKGLRWIPRQRKLAVVAFVVILTAGLGLGMFLFRSRSNRSSPPNSTRLTNIGRVTLTSISPNGEYVAYVVREDKLQSVWLLHRPSSRNIEIIPAVEKTYWTINFTPDGNHIEYNLFPEQVLYRVSLFGGPTTKVLEQISSGVAYSPNGNQMAFVRPGDDKLHLVVANADGSNQKVLASTIDGERFAYFPSTLAWSPDGASIALIVWRRGPNDAQFFPVVFGAVDGKRLELKSHQWVALRGVSWVNDGSALLIVASDEDYDSCQVWRVSCIDGSVEKVTNDVNSYATLRPNGTNSEFVTIRQVPMSTIWIVPQDDMTKATQVSSHTTDGMWGVCWTADGKLIYASKASGRFDIWIMNHDGTGRKQLTADSKANLIPTVTPDGKWIAFSSNRTGSWKIWRMGIDGTNPVPLTDLSDGYIYKAASADSRWIIYEDRNPPYFGVLKESIEGGAPIKLSQENDHWGAYLRIGASPDGKWVALSYRTANDGTTRLGIIPYDGGDLVKTFDLPADYTYECLPRWTADSKAITYARHTIGSKIWIQPIDGSPARVLVDFKSDNIWDFAWSPDGKELAVARGGRFGDVVLISNVR